MIQIRSQPGNEWEEEPLGGLQRPESVDPSVWAPASPTAERPGALRPCPRPFTGSGLIVWVSRLSRTYPLIHNSPQDQQHPTRGPEPGTRQRLGAGARVLPSAPTGLGWGRSPLGGHLSSRLPCRRPRQRCDTCWGRGLWQRAPCPFPPHHHRRRDPAPRPRPRGCHVAGQQARGPRSLYGWFTANSTLVPTVVGRPPQPLPGSWVYVLWDLLGGNPTTKR